MDNVVLYTTNCPRCKVLGMKLDAVGISYEKCDDVDEMITLGIYSTPTLSVNGKMLDFNEALRYADKKEGKV